MGNGEAQGRVDAKGLDAAPFFVQLLSACIVPDDRLAASLASDRLAAGRDGGTYPCARLADRKKETTVWAEWPNSWSENI
jgi:hypothetical protein